MTDIVIATDRYAAQRLRWRATVHPASATSADRTAGRMTWHLSQCLGGVEDHCPQGRAALEGGADPDGHCLLDGVCPRCAGAAGAGQT